MDANKFSDFLKTVDLDGYRAKYLPVKIVEMDLPKDIQAISLLYDIYWSKKELMSYNDFYRKYESNLKNKLESFRKRIMMCDKCFYLGLPARIYRTWASIITQIHAGYVAESVFGKGSVEMSEELDHRGADFRVTYLGHKLNYQVKKVTYSRGVRSQKPESKIKLDGEFVDIFYIVPSRDIFKDPKTKKGKYRKPYLDFVNNKDLERFDNGFVVFTSKSFKDKKKEIDARLK